MEQSSVAPMRWLVVAVGSLLVQRADLFNGLDQALVHLATVIHG